MWERYSIRRLRVTVWDSVTWRDLSHEILLRREVGLGVLFSLFINGRKKIDEKNNEE